MPASDDVKPYVDTAAAADSAASELEPTGIAALEAARGVAAVGTVITFA